MFEILTAPYLDLSAVVSFAHVPRLEAPQHVPGHGVGNSAARGVCIFKPLDHAAGAGEITVAVVAEAH
jgi:hypothetical protein